MQTAVKTRDLGEHTLEELHRQGQKLDLVEGDLNEVRGVLSSAVSGLI